MDIYELAVLQLQLIEQLKSEMRDEGIEEVEISLMAENENELLFDVRFKIEGVLVSGEIVELVAAHGLN